MVETVISVLIQIGIVLCSAAIYVVWVAKILPKLLLRPMYDISVMGDRGIKKYTFQNGRAIVYEPSVSSQKYIKQYILSSNNGEKYIKCKLDDRITSIKYDVVAMRSDDQVIDTVQVAEIISTKGMTRGALLPHETSYVLVVVKEINNRQVATDAKLTLPLLKVVVYVLVTVLCTVIEGILLKALTASFLETVLSYSVSTNLLSHIAALFVYTIIGTAVSLMTVFFHCSKEVKIHK